MGLAETKADLQLCPARQVQGVEPSCNARVCQKTTGKVLAYAHSHILIAFSLDQGIVSGLSRQLPCIAGSWRPLRSHGIPGSSTRGYSYV